MKYCFSIILFITTLYSQTTPVRGLVVDASTQLPIQGCHVVSGPKGAVTSEDGTFTLEVEPDDLLTFQHIAYESLSIRARRVEAIVPLQARVLKGDAIRVVGALSSQSLLRSETGTSVIRGRDIVASSEPQFQKLIDHLPNVNWAGGSSRPRYFQIRGVGERSQYAGDGPPNFSVGFTIDDLDLSGMGMAGLTYDIHHLELFRGPQSSIYGPNAIAGFIMMRSREASPYSKNTIILGVGNHSTLRLGTALNLISRADLGARLTLYRAYNNGFRSNEYLKDHTSNERDELFARINAFWYPMGQLKIQSIMLSANLQNGYDVWSPDNSAHKTYSNRPGEDSQKLMGTVIRAEYALNKASSITSITTATKADMVHSYDSDWGNDDFWKRSPYNFDPVVEGWSYDFFDRINRTRETQTQELRFNYTPQASGLNVIAGAYYKDLQEDDDAEGWLFGGDESSLLSQFDLTNLSFYAQIEYELIKGLTAITNFRTGERHTSYSDDKGTNFSINDRLSGGKIALRYDLNERQSVFTNLTRGYKAGGINQHPRILDAHRPFLPEYVMSGELGYRIASDRGLLSIVGFTTRRTDQQVSISSQQDPNDPNSFTYYIGNAGKGSSTGLEFEFDQQITDRLRTRGSIGLLSSGTDAYSFEIAPGTFISLGDREFAHAPTYTFSVNLEYAVLEKLTASCNLTAKDAYYYSESHDQRSEAYQLVNGGLDYQLTTKLLLKFWADNILNTEYPVRGFYFGLEPPDYADKLYESFGDPRHYGISVQYAF